MSFQQLVRNYMEQNDSSTVIDRSRSRLPTWLRKVAGPAAIGLSLSFGMAGAGCGGMDPSEDQAALTEDDSGKADSTGKKSCKTNRDCKAGQHCEVKSSCPPNAYCILPPNYKKGKCVDNADCNTGSDCAKGQVCIGGTEETEPTDETTKGSCPPGAYCILPPNPTPDPTPAKTGTCVNECSTDKDCAKSERCTKEERNCPPGAYCILPPSPTPRKGICELHIYAILPPASK